MALSLKGYLGAAVAIGAAVLAAPAAYAQIATTLEQAELAGLSADKRAEVESRLKQAARRSAKSCKRCC